MPIFNALLSRENWNSKYRYDGETPLQTFLRVARACAEPERLYGGTDETVDYWTDQFVKCLVDFEEIPPYEGAESEEDVYVDPDGTVYRAMGLKATTGGRITANAGTAYEKTTPWNCFINSPVSSGKITYSKRVPNSDQLIDCSLEGEQTPDNLTNIFLSLLEAAETLKSEGGYGINFGFIRPRSTLIEGVGIRHPGVVSYMELWDKMSSIIVRGDNDGYRDSLDNYLTTETVDRIEKKQPRKGAMMAVLPIWHPDVEEFIRAKQEAGRLTKFNISVLIDDAFMEAVVTDSMYDLHFNGNVYKRVKAAELYNLIMESTYNRAEPGVLFLDNMNRNNPLIYLGPVTASNPCVVGDTLVAVADGRNAVPIRQLVEEGQDVPVYSVNTESGQTEIKMGCNFRKTGESVEVWKIVLDDGSELIATPDHKILTRDLTYVELKDLMEGQSVMPFNTFNSNGYRQVSNVGDKMAGSDWHRNRRQYRLIHEFYSGRKVDAKTFAIHHANFDSQDDRFDNLEVMTHEDHRELHADKMRGRNNPYYTHFSEEDRFEFASHPGETNPKYSGHTNEELLEHGKKLYEDLGRIQKRDWIKYAKEHGLPQHLANDFRFGQFSNFQSLVVGNHKVVSVEYYGQEDVYDCTVPGNSNYCVITAGDGDRWVESSGITVHNCGEIPGSSFMDMGYKPADYLKPYMEGWDEHFIGFTTVCLLGSINLTRFVSTEDRSFDFERYAETVEVLARLLENVNDSGEVPLPAYEWAVKNIRQYGMGVNGLGSALYMMGLQYGSDAAEKFIERIHVIKDDLTLKASALLARDRGPFPMYDERYLDTPYFRDYCRASEESISLARQYGLRNAKRLTNPPLGNSSVICDLVSNSIEPVFAYGYERTVIADEWPEGLTRDNVRDILEEVQVGDATAWRGEYQGRVWYYEPHNRGLCFIDKVEDYGYSWLKDHYPEDLDEQLRLAESPEAKESGQFYLVATKDLGVMDHVRAQAAVQANCDQSVSKCLVKGQLIETDRGPVPIEDLMEGSPVNEGFYPSIQGAKVYGPDGELIRVKRSYYGGMKPALRIRTDNGEIVECSEEHRFLTPSGWKKASELTKTDLIRSVDMEYSHGSGGQDLNFDLEGLNLHYYKPISLPESMTPAFAEFLGMMASDGCVGKNSISLAEKDSVVGQRFDELCLSIFGRECGTWVDTRNDVKNHAIHSTPLAFLLKHLFRGSTAFDKSVPKQVLAGSKAEKLAFLRGLSLDGFVLPGREGFCLYSGCSQPLARGAELMARQLWGSQVYSGTPQITITGNPSYSVVTYCTDDFEAIETHKQVVLNTRRDRAVGIDPDQLFDLVYPSNTSNYNSLSSLKSRRATTLRRSTSERHNLPYVEGSKVASIESLGLREVFDIEVDHPEHAYLVEGLISHNTCNLPMDYPFEDFKDLYIEAWRQGLVGFTTYREGIMESVLSTGTTGTSKARNLLDLLLERDLIPDGAEITEDGVVVRDVYLPSTYGNGETQKVRADGNKYYLHLSYLPDDDQFPIALWVHSNGMEPGEYVSLNRAIKSVTKLLLDKGVDFDLVYEQLEKVSDDVHHVKLGKSIAMALRHCITLEEIIGALSGVEGDHIASTLTAVRKFLKLHVEDGTVVVNESCPQCGSEDLVYEAGCSTCRSCGNSGCG